MKVTARLRYWVRLGLQRLVDHYGWELVQKRVPSDFTPTDLSIVTQVTPYTQTPPGRIKCLLDAVRYIIRNEIPGGIVECGVWKGGSMMAAALALQELGQTDRELFLYDTFAGMTRPGPEDRAASGASASTIPAYRASLSTVEANLRSTGYPDDRIHCIAGDVCETLPRLAPNIPIALLRLDTDWYKSTRHELEQLFGLLSPKGILIIDDYGSWLGARQAVDEFIQSAPQPIFLARADETCRVVVK